MPAKKTTTPKSTAKPDADPALDLDNSASEAETVSISSEPTASDAPATGSSEPETSSEAETVSASDAAKPEQDADKTAAEAVETSETDAAGIPAATGVRRIFLLKASALGRDGEVVRLSNRKIADLGLKEGEDFRAPTALELAIGG
jgi:hypothetical protein